MERIILSRVVTGRLPYENVEPNSVVLIGNAKEGPGGIPIEGSTIEEVENWFGTDSELTNAYREFRTISPSKVYLIKTNGNPAKTTLHDSLLQPKLSLTTINFNKEQNRKYCNLYVSTDSKTGETATILDIRNQLTGDRYKIDITNKTTKELAALINREAFLGNMDIYAEATTDEPCSVLIEQEHSFSGGDDSVQRLEAILNDLLTIGIKQVGILNDNFFQYITGRGWVYQLVSDFAENKAKTSMPCLVTIGIPPQYPINNLHQDLIKFTTDYKERYAASEFINFMVARAKVSNTAAGYTSNGVASYCGMISLLSVGESTTSKVLPNIRSNILPLTDSQIKELSDFGYVVLSKDNFNRATIYKGVNLIHGTKGFSYSFQKNSDGSIEVIEYYKAYHIGYLSNVTLVQDIAFKLHDLLEPLISTSATVKDIEAAASQVLNNYQGIIKDSSYVVTEKVEGFTKAYELTINIVPYGEIDIMSFTVSIW